MEKCLKTLIVRPFNQNQDLCLVVYFLDLVVFVPSCYHRDYSSAFRVYYVKTSIISPTFHGLCLSYFLPPGRPPAALVPAEICLCLSICGFSC